jgi:hypothetical protein
MRFGNSGYGYDLVNGLHRTEPEPQGSGQGGKMVNRDLIKMHEIDTRNEKLFFAGFVVAVLVAIVFRLFVLAVVIVVALLGWAAWSGSDGARDAHCVQDPATGDWFPADDTAKMMIGYGRMFEPFIERENRLIDVLVSGKTLPPEMSDSTVSIECSEYDDAKTVFEIHVAAVNGAVAYVKKCLPDIAGAFGDPDRYEFRKTGGDERGWSVWRLTVYEMPKNISAGVSWE